MSRLFDAIQKSQGRLGEIGRNLVSDAPPVMSEPEQAMPREGMEELAAPAEIQPAAIQPGLVTPEDSGPLVEVATSVVRKRRRGYAVVVLALCSVAGYAGYRVYHGQGILPPWIARPAASDEMRFTGVVVAQETTVAAKIPGRIERLLVDEGSIVKAGDVIATLDRQETVAERDNQQAKVDQLNARLSQTEEMLRLESERNEHQLQRAAAQLKATESELRTAQVELQQSRRELDRGRQLRQAGVIAARDMEQYQLTVQVNEARVKSLEERVLASRADLDLMRSNLRQVTVAASDVDQTRAQIVQAQALRQQAEVRLEYSTVRAPMSGLVSVRVARQGEIVGVGTPIVTLVDLSDTWVKADVEETWMNRIHLGMHLPVQLASGERTGGEVFFISPEAEFATQRDINRVKRDVRTFGIKIRLQNESRRIHPGMTAYVMLPKSSTAGVE
jgi:multidrug resistance efflux pump